MVASSGAHNAEVRELAELGRARGAHPALRAFAVWYGDSYGWKFRLPEQLSYVGLSCPERLLEAAQAARGATSWTDADVSATRQVVQELVDAVGQRRFYTGLKRLAAQLAHGR